MTAIPPAAAQLLATRLRMAADEIESAARYGVPIPPNVSVDSYDHGGLSFHAMPDEFDAWERYTDAAWENYEHDGSQWSKGEADCNGLRVTFATRHVSAEAPC